MKIVIAHEGGVLTAHRDTRTWKAHTSLEQSSPECLVAHDRHRDVLFCGTFESGVWKSENGGHWFQVGTETVTGSVTSLAAGRRANSNGYSPLFAGTEPSALYRSDDGGASWRRCDGLTDLPSASSWSFPPRPSTHHVKWIEEDPSRPEILFLAIEAGALVVTPDGGNTWTDRVAGGPRDTHTLRMHAGAPGRIYAAAGDGYFESADSGRSWSRPREGLSHHYCWSIAVDVADPDFRLMSAASGPGSAHNAGRAESFIYRRTGQSTWHVAMEGLPEPAGTLRSVITAHPQTSGVYYLANNHGVFETRNGAESWKWLDIPWPHPAGENAYPRVDDLLILPDSP